MPFIVVGVAARLPTVAISTSYMLSAAIERVTLDFASPLDKYVNPYRNDAVRVNSTVSVETLEMTLITLATNGPVGEKEIRRSAGWSSFRSSIG